jgi:uncharacterized protein (DUF1684 family)
MAASNLLFPKIFLRTFLAFALACTLCTAATAVADNAAYKSSVEKWRKDYENDLKSDHGWLSISGLFWLHEGENRFGSDPLNDIALPESSTPADAGYFELKAGKITVHVKRGVSITMNGKPVETAELHPDSSEDRLTIGDLQLWVHASGGRFAIRLRDKNSKLRQNFTGLHWFPVDESNRVIAHYTPYEKEKQVDIQNLAGDAIKLPISGYVTFTLRGQELRLEAETDDKGALSFVFRDLTSGKETYGAGRFLDTDPVKNGEVVLDFNEAYNPPCAYNPYTTCPIPPPENRLRARIEAGEMSYKHDH